MCTIYKSCVKYYALQLVHITKIISSVLLSLILPKVKRKCNTNAGKTRSYCQLLVFIFLVDMPIIDKTKQILTYIDLSLIGILIHKRKFGQGVYINF